MSANKKQPLFSWGVIQPTACGSGGIGGVSDDDEYGNPRPVDSNKTRIQQPLKFSRKKCIKTDRRCRRKEVETREKCLIDV